MSAIEATGSDAAGRPGWVTTTLAAAGIDPDEGVAALREQLTALELELLEVGEEWTRVPHGTPRYFAAVAEAEGNPPLVGVTRSPLGPAEALAGAMAQVLRERLAADDGRTDTAA